MPIAAVPGTHTETCEASAIAAGTLFATHYDDPEIQSWFHNDQTKSVRKISRDSQERKIQELPHTYAEVGEARAYAFQPMAREDFPKPISRLQVAGLEADRDWESADRTPILYVTPTVLMSTGKTAAQCAHAICMWLDAGGEKRREEWLANPGLSVVTGVPTGEVVLEVVDNGKTEIKPGTVTVRLSHK